MDTAAAAASALLSVFPCSKVPGALQNAEVAEAARQVAAMEQMLGSWGAKVRSQPAGRRLECDGLTAVSTGLIL